LEREKKKRKSNHNQLETKEKKIQTKDFIKHLNLIEMQTSNSQHFKHSKLCLK
jgi:hypothetical protein